MIRVALLTDMLGSDGLIREALSMLEGENVTIDSIDYFDHIESVVQAVWALLNRSDIIVAHATSESRNLYYEIGLAHGLGKPVILLSERFSSLPQDLMGQRLISIGKQDTPQTIAFRIREAMEEIQKTSRGEAEFSGFRGPQERATTYPTSSYEGDFSLEFRGLFQYQGIARHARFEDWFCNVARHIEGWEVVGSDKQYRDSTAFDLVIWNSREDFELNTLGNPIVVELKSVRTMDSTSIRRLIQRAKANGLRTLVLATTGINDDRAKALITRMRKQEGINVITMDRDDLINVRNPDGLLHLFKEKVRESLYREDS